MKNRPYSQDKNKLWGKHRPKYAKYKKCLVNMMSIYIKQHLSNI